MIKAHKTGDHQAQVTWSPADDPRGWLAAAIEAGHLENALAALADPMQLAHVAAREQEAREQLRSVSWLMDQLGRRTDALVVHLKDGGTSWLELARLVAPDDDNPAHLRSAMQRRYETGRRRTGLPFPESRA